jgi:hypothetical protein
MIKLFNTMIQSRDKNPSHDKHVANVLGDLHTDLTSFLDLITFIQQWQNNNINVVDSVDMHQILL